MTSRLLAAGCGAGFIVCMSCGGPRPEPAGYDEGTVQVASDGTPTISGKPVRMADRPEFSQSLRHLEGNRVGIEYGGGQAKLVTPLQNDWNQLAQNITVRDILDQPRAVAQHSMRDSLRGQMTALTASFDSLARSTDSDQMAKLVSVVDDYHALSQQAINAASESVAEKDRDELVAFAFEARQEAVLGRPMGYRGPFTREPEFYRRVARNVDGAVAVYKGSMLDGSGFLVAPDWVVTCSHVVQSLPTFAGLKVAFDYESATGTSGSRECSVVDWRKPDTGVDWVDIAALKISCSTINAAQRKARTLVLSTRAPSLDEYLYVIGHPSRSFKVVSDNSTLTFPHEVNAATHQVLRRGQEPNSNALSWFDSYYKQCGANWCYFSPQTRWSLGTDTEPRIPTFGFAADTMPGNSGSAIFFVDDHSVAGLYFAGAADFSRLGRLDFSRHEAAIPAFALRKWLDAKGVR